MLLPSSMQAHCLHLHEARRLLPKKYIFENVCSLVALLQSAAPTVPTQGGFRAPIIVSEPGFSKSIQVRSMHSPYSSYISYQHLCEVQVLDHTRLRPLRLIETLVCTK